MGQAFESAVCDVAVAESSGSRTDRIADACMSDALLFWRLSTTAVTLEGKTVNGRVNPAASRVAVRHSNLTRTVLWHNHRLLYTKLYCNVGWAS